MEFGKDCFEERLGVLKLSSKYETPIKEVKVSNKLS